MKVFVSSLVYKRLTETEPMVEVTFIRAAIPPYTAVMMLLPWSQKGVYPIGSEWELKVAENGVMSLLPAKGTPAKDKE
ncbi:MAG: hypothetical protein KGJ23_07965 [Euryarchaeota archaeon]|nr:hypothetical protein [Euryarchaeota archaeon]MDE1836536.1 hypothetical protein [Euryarchaeota archaeon]MDE1879269.1 hypothetical protein [Euryarchaeota archaeon]MDE2044506.1 hypothetical protein [Thermoplasmata archaeon]